MIAYQFESKTGYYTGPAPCQLDPVASERSGRAEYLLPGDCTWTPPPDYDTQTRIPVWDGHSWNLEQIDAPVQVPDSTDDGPTFAEQLRADVDYVAAMLGVEL